MCGRYVYCAVLAGVGECVLYASDSLPAGESQSEGQHKQQEEKGPWYFYIHGLMIYALSSLNL